MQLLICFATSVVSIKYKYRFATKEQKSLWRNMRKWQGHPWLAIS